MSSPLPDLVKYHPKQLAGASQLFQIPTAPLSCFRTGLSTTDALSTWVTACSIHADYA